LKPIASLVAGGNHEAGPASKKEVGGVAHPLEYPNTSSGKKGGKGGGDAHPII